MKSPPKADTSQPLHHREPSAGMGDNFAQRMTSSPATPPCCTLGGGAGHDDPTTTPSLLPSHHHTPLPPLTNNHWLTSNGFCSSSGQGSASSSLLTNGSPHGADSSPSPSLSPLPSCRAEEEEEEAQKQKSERDLESDAERGQPKFVAKGTPATSPRHSAVAGCSCLLVDAPARCCQTEDTGNNVSRHGDQPCSPTKDKAAEPTEDSRTHASSTPVEAGARTEVVVVVVPNDAHQPCSPQKDKAADLPEPTEDSRTHASSTLVEGEPGAGVGVVPNDAQDLAEDGADTAKHRQDLTPHPHQNLNGRWQDQELAILSISGVTVIDGKQIPKQQQEKKQEKTADDAQAGSPTRVNTTHHTDTANRPVMVAMETEQKPPPTISIHPSPDAESPGHKVTSNQSQDEDRDCKEKLEDEHEEEEEEEMREDEEEGEEAKDDDLDDDDDDDGDEEVAGAYKAKDIDQGWAWVVLVSAFLGMTIFGTFTFSIGIFQAEILQVVEPDIQKTSWVGATHFSTLCMMGPFAGLIKNKLGSRKTVLMSSVIICFGMIAASLSVNVIQLILTYGVITGIGTGMALNPMFICVSFYFEQYRGFASGVIAAGAGAGMFVGGPIIRKLMETYGLSGTFLIWGAVGLNIGVAGMVMLPSSLERRREMGEMEGEVVVGGGGGAGGRRRRGRGQGVAGMRGGMDSALLASVSTLPSAGGGYWGSVLGLSSFMVGREKEADSLTCLQHSQNRLDVAHIQDAIRSYSELSALSPEAMETAFRTSWLTRNFRSSQLSVQNSLDSASTGRWRFSPRLFRKNSRTPDPEKGGEEEDEEEEGRFLRDGGACLSKPLCRGSCHGLLDLVRILSNPGFSLYMFSGSMWIFGESIVYAYLPTYAQAQGSTPFQAAILITALGFTSTFSRLVVGFVASHPSIGPDLMHVGMLGLCGLFTLTFPLYSSSFTGQLAFAAIYGLYAGGLSSVINIVIISLMGVQHIALAFGLICFGQGIASLAGPPISGAIVHAGGTYDDVFMFSGSLLLVGGFCGFPMVLCRPRPSSPSPPPPPPPPPEEEVEEKVGETTPAVRIRMKGDTSYT
ncbi:uncharacterized protein LOC143288947 isoform X2 [Babylonia areolata]|uniref:uncharacterized protein LOC143288947 isoform X2 n=1 Tax=Babylonia areolata TaxID=304850 RepID=UPI003FCF74E8